MRAYLFTALVVASCATKTEQVGRSFFTPDGRAAWEVKCDDPKTAPDCHVDARALCKGDYEVLKESEAPLLRTNGWTGTQATRIFRVMEVACKAPPT